MVTINWDWYLKYPKNYFEIQYDENLKTNVLYLNTDSLIEFEDALYERVIKNKPDKPFIILSKMGRINCDIHDVILRHPLKFLEDNGFKRTFFKYTCSKRYDNREERYFVAELRKDNIIVKFYGRTIAFSSYSYDEVERVEIVVV